MREVSTKDLNPVSGGVDEIVVTGVAIAAGFSAYDARSWWGGGMQEWDTDTPNDREEPRNPRFADANDNGVPDDIDNQIMSLADSLGNGNGRIDGPEENRIVRELTDYAYEEISRGFADQVREGIEDVRGIPDDIIEGATDIGAENLGDIEEYLNKNFDNPGQGGGSNSGNPGSSHPGSGDPNVHKP